jgi:hypothetical protein
MAERDRIRPSVAGRARLLAAVEAGTPACALEPGALGEYAVLLAERGQAAADAAFPETASHVRAGCATCPDDLREIQGLLQAADEPAPAPSVQDSDVHPAELRHAIQADQDVSLVTSRPAPAASAPRRRLAPRDWLLIATATVVVLVGMALIGMAYVVATRGGPPIQVAPTIQPAFKPAPPVQSVGTPSAGRAAPSGMSCPATHPIKGNRESMIYHQPGAEFYDRTRPEDCFMTPAEAEAAGYRPSRQ